MVQAYAAPFRRSMIDFPLTAGLNFRYWRLCRLLILLSLIVCSNKVFPTTVVAPDTFYVVQPSGFRFEVTPKGDIHQNWTETSSGHTVINISGVWYFAADPASDAASLRSSNIEVTEKTLASPPSSAQGVRPGRVLPEDSSSTHNPSSSAVAGDLNGISFSSIYPNPKGSYRTLFHSLDPLDGARTASPALTNVTQKVLLIMLEYQNQEFNYGPGSFNSLIFGSGSGSVKSYFLENSYDTFTVAPAEETDTSAGGTANDGIIKVAIARDHPNTKYLNNTDKHEAIDLASASIDFSDFDTDKDKNLSDEELSIVFIVAGYENAYGGDGAKEPRVWGHKSSLGRKTADGVQLARYAMFGEQHVYASENVNRQASIGIIAHELGHLMLGLPDIYDTNSDNNGTTGGDAGVGDWGLMASGTWNKLAGQASGTKPGLMLGWSKINSNRPMATYEILDKATDNSVLQLDGADAESDYLLIKPEYDNYGFTTEYFLLENRQQEGFDEALPAEGLIITHNGVGKNNSDRNSGVQVEIEMPSGGEYSGAEAPWPRGATTTFDDDSAHGNAKWSFGDSNISLTNIAITGDRVTAKLAGLTDRGPQRSHIATGKENKTNLGCVDTPVFLAGSQYTNSSNKFVGITGIQIPSTAAAPAATFDVRVYKSITGNTPSGLLGTITDIDQTQFSGTRAFFEDPIPMPKDSTYFVAVIHEADDNVRAPQDTGSSKSPNWYTCSNGDIATDKSLSPLPAAYDGDFLDILLMSQGHTATSMEFAGSDLTPDMAFAEMDSGDPVTVTVDVADGYVLAEMSGTCPAGNFSGDDYTTGVLTQDCELRPATLLDSDGDGRPNMCFAISSFGGSGETYVRVDTDDNPTGKGPIEGTYVRFPSTNGYHRGQLTVDGQNYRWTNEAGVTWLMSLDMAAGTLTDAEGSPYELTRALDSFELAGCGSLTLDDDDDGDSVPDTEDAYPLISLGGRTDTDGDGLPNDCDSDCKSLGMVADNDDDNDGLFDIHDAYPLASLGDLVDTDGDGRPNDCDADCQAAGMAADPDDDNDLVLDTLDLSPLDAAIGGLAYDNAGDSASPGTRDNPYRISTASELKSLGTTYGYWASGVHLLLLNDIDAAESSGWDVGDHDRDGDTPDEAMGFIPLGTYGNRFSAQLNGNGKVISNLFINRPSIWDVGFLGATNNAFVIDLGLENVEFTGRTYVGGIVGWASSTAVVSCFVTGSVSGNAIVGGLIGYTDSAAEVSYTAAAVNAIDSSVGGLIGRQGGDSNLRSSYSDSAVTSSSEAVTSIGGLVGRLQGSASVTNSFWNSSKTAGLGGVGDSIGTGSVEMSSLNNSEMLKKSKFTGFDFVGDPDASPPVPADWAIVDGFSAPQVWWQDDDDDDILAYLDTDADNDSVSNQSDKFPFNIAAAEDTDGDGRPDKWNANCDSTCQGLAGLVLDMDDDNDGVPDSADTDPFDPYLCRDLDDDTADDCSVGVDGFGPLDDFDVSNDGLDTDGDGLANVGDTDDDNDGVSDADDEFPLDATESNDADDDGLGDNADLCDGTPEEQWAQIDTQGCSPFEKDTDGDGVNDAFDAFPTDATETSDLDGDGYGDNWENDAGTDPNDARDYPVNSLPIWLLYQATQ